MDGHQKHERCPTCGTNDPTGRRKLMVQHFATNCPDPWHDPWQRGAERVTQKKRMNRCAAHLMCPDDRRSH